MASISLQSRHLTRVHHNVSEFIDDLEDQLDKQDVRIKDLESSVGDTDDLEEEKRELEDQHYKDERTIEKLQAEIKKLSK